MARSPLDECFRYRRVTLGHPGNSLSQRKLASLRLEIPEGVKEVYLTNRERDDLPPLIVGNATWEYFPLP
jgi:hypothetical protein